MTTFGGEREPRRRPRHRSGRNGQAMMEFALIFPLLLLLALSCLDYGYYLEHVDSVQGVVRDGARYASENTTASPWNSSCPDPTPLSTGGWSCAGLVTQVASGENGSVDLATIDVTSIAGFTGFTDGFDVTTTASLNGTNTLVVISCDGTESSPVVAFTGCSTTSSASATLQPGYPMNGESDFTEGVIQQESEALTVPEGGLPIDNIDCCWSGSSGGTGCPSGSGITPVWGAGVGVPSSGTTLGWPVTGISSQAPFSCMTISYWSNSGDGYYTPPLSLCAWWSADASSETGTLENNGTCGEGETGLSGDLVQITVAYRWSQEAPGPAFAVLNSVFGINVQASATYSFVVSN
jgi:Flp pilus assembly protein TadG